MTHNDNRLRLRSVDFDIFFLTKQKYHKLHVLIIHTAEFDGLKT